MATQLAPTVWFQFFIALGSIGLFFAAVFSAIFETIRNMLQSFKGK